MKPMIADDMFESAELAIAPVCWFSITCSSSERIAELAFAADAATTAAPSGGPSSGGMAGTGTSGSGGIGGAEPPERAWSILAHAAVVAAELTMLLACWRITALCIAIPSASAMTALSIAWELAGDAPLLTKLTAATESTIWLLSVLSAMGTNLLLIICGRSPLREPPRR
jgi:hypothetical protein